MKYYSTRDVSLRYQAAEAIKMGLSRDGGLLTPVEIPRIDEAFLREMLSASYQERAARVMGLYLTDYSPEELISVVMADKKRVGDDISVVLIEDIGKAVIKKLQIQKIGFSCFSIIRLRRSSYF